SCQSRANAQLGITSSIREASPAGLQGPPPRLSRAARRAARRAAAQGGVAGARARCDMVCPVTTRLIGARIRRNEDPRLLRGLGCFVADLSPPGVLHAAGVRSPHAHARIASVDAARARALPGVHLVLTAADLGPLNEPTPLLIPHPGLTQ